MNIVFDKNICLFKNNIYINRTHISECGLFLSLKIILLYVIPVVLLMQYHQFVCEVQW